MEDGQNPNHFHSMTLILDRIPKFPLGDSYATANAIAAFSNWELLRCFMRHSQGDWGDLDEEDRRANERSLQDGTRLLSAYRFSDGRRLWIITEADRSATTILLPEDY